MSLSSFPPISERQIQLSSSKKQFLAFLAATALSELHASALNCDDGSGVLYCNQLADFRKLAEATHLWLEERCAGNDFSAPQTELERRDFQFREILGETRRRLVEIPDPLEPEHLVNAETQIKLAELTQFLGDPRQMTFYDRGGRESTLFMAVANLYRSSRIENSPQQLDAPSEHISMTRSDTLSASSLTVPQKCSVMQLLHDISETGRNANLGSVRLLVELAGKTLEKAAGPDRALLAEVSDSLERLNQRQFHFIVERLDHQFDLLRARISEPHRHGEPTFISSGINLTGALPLGTHLRKQDQLLFNFCDAKQQILHRWHEDPNACVNASPREFQRIGNQAEQYAQRLTTEDTEQLRRELTTPEIERLRNDLNRNMSMQNPFQYVTPANAKRRSIISSPHPIAIPSRPNSSVDELPPLAAAVGM